MSPCLHDCRCHALPTPLAIVVLRSNRRRNDRPRILSSGTLSQGRFHPFRCEGSVSQADAGQLHDCI